MVDIGESGSGLRQAKVDGMKWQFPRAEWKRTLAMLDSGKALLLRRGENAPVPDNTCGRIVKSGINS